MDGELSGALAWRNRLADSVHVSDIDRALNRFFMDIVDVVRSDN